MSALSPQKALSAKKLISVRQRLALVPATGRSSASRTPFVVFMVVLLIGGVVGLLAFNTEMQQRSFAASKLQREATALVAKRQQLKMSLQELNSPQHLADAASKLPLRRTRFVTSRPSTRNTAAAGMARVNTRASDRPTPSPSEAARDAGSWSALRSACSGSDAAASPVPRRLIGRR